MIAVHEHCDSDTGIKAFQRAQFDVCLWLCELW